jgi:hypothetical protein
VVEVIAVGEMVVGPGYSMAANIPSDAMEEEVDTVQDDCWEMPLVVQYERNPHY